jgi:hypothetical protein
MSLVLATSILAVGGIGLYMYKSSNDGEESEDNYIFEKNNFWGFDDDEDVDEDKSEHSEEEEEEEYKPKKRTNKTKRKKASGGTKRNY